MACSVLGARWRGQVRRELRDCTPRIAATLRHYYGLRGVRAPTSGSGGDDDNDIDNEGGSTKTTQRAQTVPRHYIEEKHRSLVQQLRRHLTEVVGLRETILKQFVENWSSHQQRTQRQQQQQQQPQRPRRKRGRLPPGAGGGATVVDLLSDNDDNADVVLDGGASSGLGHEHDDDDGGGFDNDDDPNSSSSAPDSSRAANELAIHGFDAVIVQLEHALELAAGDAA